MCNKCVPVDPQSTPSVPATDPHGCDRPRAVVDLALTLEVRRECDNRSPAGDARSIWRYVLVMAKLLRSSLPDGFFHVVARAVYRAHLYRDDVDRRTFVGLLRRCCETYNWECHAYCLMSTHYHLVLEARRTELSAGVQYLNGRHAQRFNWRHERYGALFAERFSTRVVESEEHLFEACAYALLNPVKAGLCERVEQWPWSFCTFGLDAI
jgi:REP element-mobilizing transposase RayT